jgi:S1-C subfamily serine protease
MGERRWGFAAAAVAGALLCAWCSLVSGIGGWVIGGDIASREARVRFAATATAGSLLPPVGVLVTRLDRDGPAARAGVARSDVIVAVDGAPIVDARDLRDAILRAHPGDRMRLTVDRESGKVELQADLAAFPGNAQRAYLGIYFTARAEDPADL